MIQKTKGLDLVTECLPEQLQVAVCNTVQEAVTKSIHEKRKCKKAKWLSEEALQIAEKEEEPKAKEKGKSHPNECRVPDNSKER